MYCEKKFLNQGANYPSDAADGLCGADLIRLQGNFRAAAAQIAAEQAQRDGYEHIEHGVLLHEHGRGAD